MSGRWFRFYADAMRNPKVARLNDKEFRLWVELLGVAADNDGSIPYLDDLKRLLKRRLDHLSTGVERLISIGLIDDLADGYEPHHWSKFQYKSDTSTERVHKHRAKRNVSETPPEAETDTDTERTGSNEPVVRAKPNPFPKPEWADSQVWADWLEVRKAKRAKNTATAHAGFLRDIAKATDDDWPPGRLLEHAVARSWLSINRPEGFSNGRLPYQNGSGSLRGSRPDPALDMLYQAQRELQAEAEAERENPRFDRPLRLAVSSN